MPGPVVRTILNDVRCNWHHLQIAEALRSYATARAMALARGLSEEMADEVARRSIAAARSDFEVRAGAETLPGWLHAMLTPGLGREGFASRLLTQEARDFVGWLITKSGPDGVLDRESFDAIELKPWFGNLTIMRREPETGDFRYRLFGSGPCALLGRDLTGRTLAAWPSKIARVKQARVDTLVTRRVPVLVHSARMRYENGTRHRGSGVLEQLMWPLRYDASSPDAVIDLTVLVPGSRLTADALRVESRALARDFAADAAPVGCAAMAMR